jgi:precorrin-6B methylase 2
MLSSAIREYCNIIYENTIRNYLPKKLAVYNTVAIRRPRLLDITDTNQEYKPILVEPLRELCQNGDKIINIGGGWGVSTVVAARQCGPAGEVICYEGSRTYAERIKETADLNRVSDRIHVENAIVGEGIDVWGDEGDNVVPASLPECDVIVMDCEGAERSILQGLDDEQRPRLFIIESRQFQGVDPENVEQLLTKWGYQTEIRTDTIPRSMTNPTVVGVRQ